MATKCYKNLTKEIFHAGRRGLGKVVGGEDELLVLAGYRTGRPEGQELSQPRA